MCIIGLWILFRPVLMICCRFSTVGCDCYVVLAFWIWKCHPLLGVAMSAYRIVGYRANWEWVTTNSSRVLFDSPLLPWHLFQRSSSEVYAGLMWFNFNESEVHPSFQFNGIDISNHYSLLLFIFVYCAAGEPSGPGRLSEGWNHSWCCSLLGQFGSHRFVCKC